MWPWPRARNLRSANRVPMSTPPRLMSTVRWVSRGSSSTNAPMGPNAGIVAQCVEWADASFGVIQERFETVRVAHVQRQPDDPRAQLDGDDGDQVAIDVADDHGHALALTGFGGGTANAAGAPGDRDSLNRHYAKAFPTARVPRSPIWSVTTYRLTPCYDAPPTGSAS